MLRKVELAISILFLTAGVSVAADGQKDAALESRKIELLLKSLEDVTLIRRHKDNKVPSGKEFSESISNAIARRQLMAESARSLIDEIEKTDQFNRYDVANHNHRISLPSWLNASLSGIEAALSRDEKKQ